MPPGNNEVSHDALGCVYELDAGRQKGELCVYYKHPGNGSKELTKAKSIRLSSSASLCQPNCRILL